MPTFDATVGGASATSLVSVADALAILALRPGGAPTFAVADPSDQETALMVGTQLLEREPWSGAPATSGQRLSFPRRGLDALGVPMDATVIPFGIQAGVATFAERWLAAGGATTPTDPTTPTGLAALAGLVKSLKAGPITLDFATGGSAPSAETPGSSLPFEVLQWVSRYLRALVAPSVSALTVVRSS